MQTPSGVRTHEPALELIQAWDRGEQPDLRAFLKRVGVLSAAQLGTVLRVDQHERWQRGDRVPVEVFVHVCNDAGAGDQAVDLIYSEYLLREGLGEGPTIDEYLVRFPEHAEALRRQIELHQVLQGDTSDWHCTPSFSDPGKTPDAGPHEKGKGRAAASTGPKVPGYEVLWELGRGGMGVVCLARQVSLNRLVALKMLHGASLSAEDQVRFRREAEAAARLQHPNIVQVHEIGTHEGRPYFSLEYVAGGTLAQQLLGGPLAARPAAELAATLADAMHFAHQHHIIHRDLKPANVLLIGNGERGAGNTAPAGAVPKIADFGLAKLLDGSAGQTESGSILGTPSYMSPEQAAGRPDRVGPKADVYALGAILYEMVTGRPPFRGATALETLQQVRTQEPVPPRRLQPRLPRDLETICLKCLEKDPARRYADAAALAEDLRRFLAGKAIQARPARPWEPTWKWARRRPAVALLILVLTLGTPAVLAGGGWLTARLQDELANRKQQEQIARDMRGLRDDAERHRERAEVEARNAQHYLYIAHMNVAQQLWREAHLERLHELLAEQRPARPGQPDFRGFEWHYLWRLSHAEQARFKTGPGPTHAFALDSAGRRVAVGAGARVEIRDAGSGKLLHTLKGHGDYITGLAFSPDGLLLASASADRTAKLWDLDSGKEKATLPAQPTAVRGVAFSPDGSRVATAAEHEVKVWPVDGQGNVLTLNGHFPNAISVAFSPDGKRLASGGGDYLVKLWDLATGKEMASFPGHRRNVIALAFDRSGQFLASGSADRTAKVWDVRTGREKFTCFGHSETVKALAFNAHGTRLASGSLDRTARVWKVETGEEEFALRGHAAPVQGVAFSANGWELFTLSGDPLLAPQLPSEVKVWDGLAGPENRTFPGGRSADLSPDGRWLLVARMNEVLLFAVDSPAPARVVARHPAQVNAVAFSPDGRRFVAGDQQRTAVVWDIVTGKKVCSFQRHKGAIQALAFDPLGRRVVSCGDEATVRLWDAATGDPLRELAGHDGFAWAVAFSADGRRVATGGHDNTARVWDLAGGTVRKLTRHGHWVNAVAFSPDGRQLATASGDKTIRMWDVETGRAGAVLKGHTGQVLDLRYAPDGRRLVSAGEDRAVKLWDVPTGQEVLTLAGHQLLVKEVHFGLDGQRLLSVGAEGVRTWDAAVRKPNEPRP